MRVFIDTSQNISHEDMSYFQTEIEKILAIEAILKLNLLVGIYDRGEENER